MNKQDLGLYLMMWLMLSVLIWMLDVDESFSVKAKIIIPILLTMIMILFRISVYLITGE